MTIPPQPPRTPYRIVVRTGTVSIEQWHGEALGYLPRAHVGRAVWDRIGPPLHAAILGQRERAGQRRGSWRSPIALSREEGKEALLLFWGAERAALEQLPAVIANWRGLAPEERWWIVTQADATRGHPSYSPTRGWRQAIYHILVENSVF